MAFGEDFRLKKGAKMLQRENVMIPNTTRNKVKLENIFRQRKHTLQNEALSKIK